MEQDEYETTLTDAEKKLDRVRALYEQFFRGIERLEPTVPRKELERALDQLRRVQIRKASLRFRFNTLTQRYTSYQTYWRRILRQIEEGTFQRDIVRAKKIFAEPVVRAPELDEELMATLRPGLGAGIDEEAVTLRPTVGGGAEHVDDEEVDTLPPTEPGVLATEAEAHDTEPPSTSRRPSTGWPADLPIADEGSYPALPGAALRPGAPDAARAARGPTAGAATAPAEAPAKRRFGRPQSISFQVATLRGQAGDSAAPPRGTTGAPDPGGEPGEAEPATTPPPAYKPPPPAALQGPAPPPARAPAGPAKAATPAPPAPPPPAPSHAARPAPPPARPHPPAPAAEEARLRAVYDAYIAARRQNQERTDNVPFEKVSKSLREIATKLGQKHAGKRIDFEVVIKDGRVGFKGVPKG